MGRILLLGGEECFEKRSSENLNFLVLFKNRITWFWTFQLQLNNDVPQEMRTRLQTT